MLLTVRFFENALHDDVRRAWVKDVYLFFEALDFPLQKQKMMKERNDDSYDSWEWHALFKKILRHYFWPKKIGLVMEHLALDSFTVDFWHATCTDKCKCPRENSAIAAFAEGFKHGVPATFDLHGLENNWKPDDVRSMVRRWTEAREETLIPLSRGLAENEDILSAVGEDMDEEEYFNPEEQGNLDTDEEELQHDAVHVVIPH